MINKLSPSILATSSFDPLVSSRTFPGRSARLHLVSESNALPLLGLFPQAHPRPCHSAPFCRCAGVAIILVHRYPDGFKLIAIETADGKFLHAQPLRQHDRQPFGRQHRRDRRRYRLRMGSLHRSGVSIPVSLTLNVLVSDHALQRPSTFARTFQVQSVKAAVLRGKIVVVRCLGNHLVDRRDRASEWMTSSSY